jgi:hypothetical protein
VTIGHPDEWTMRVLRVVRHDGDITVQLSGSMASQNLFRIRLSDWNHIGFSSLRTLNWTTCCALFVLKCLFRHSLTSLVSGFVPSFFFGFSSILDKVAKIRSGTQRLHFVTRTNSSEF